LPALAAGRFAGLTKIDIFPRKSALPTQGYSSTLPGSSSMAESPVIPSAARGPRPGFAAIAWPLLLLGGLWGWAIWSAAEHWQANPNYSYGWAVPLLAIGFAVRRFLQAQKDDVDLVHVDLTKTAVIAISIGALVFALEYARNQVWHPIVVIWSIALLAIVATFALLHRIGGRALVRAEIFPVCFFLSALPWPPRFEQPITTTLMRSVALATTEILHWLGIQAQASGGAIALRDGLVGITEACSGIRSLQAGIMFGLAMGEWFLLSRARRIVLLFIAIAFAMATNLARTLALTLQANAHGIDSVERVHDLIGNIVMTALILAIWLAGKLLSARHGESVPWRIRSTSSSVAADVVRGPRSSTAATTFVPATIAVIVGLIAARGLAAHIEARDKTQTAPFFSVIENAANKPGVIPKTVWNELHPTSGEYIRHDPTSAEATAGRDINLNERAADCFHFFWKPSPWNRFALVHRPDICMPGIGWQLDGRAEMQDVDLSGRTLRFYLFRFHRDNVHALELWGAWRNGEPVPIDYKPDQVLGAAAPPATMQVTGKRKSATEIVSCSVLSQDRQPPVEKAIETLRAVFNFNPP
jgi:exosortase